MKAKTIIKLVYFVCWFIKEAFIERDRGLTSLALEEIKNLKDEV